MRITLFFLILLSIGTTYARSSRFGLGVVFGDPTAGSIIYELESSNFLKGQAGLGLFGGDNFTFTLDYLVRKKVDELRPVDLYYGSGLTLSDKKRDTHFGVRLPIGLQYNLPDIRGWSLFTELVPVVEVSPKIDGDIQGGLGFHYLF